MRWGRRLRIVGLAVMPALTSFSAESSAQKALQELRTFATTGRVLHLAAHPDDENTQLIAYLSRGRGYATAYLSVTRGDGGQNLLGPQFDEKLGVARTQELLAARRIDGGRQFFTRAIDFGFSKNPEETLAIWGHQEVLGDVVRVIRRFRPDVVITRFPTPPGSGGHGHHTASAILAVEAFKAAADPQAFPDQLAAGLQPWQVKRVLWNGSSWFGRSALDNNPTIKVDISGTDPASGESFSSLATRSRRMHKTQALGEAGNRDITTENFILLAGEPAQQDLMDGVDTTWSRYDGGAAIGEQARAVLDAYRPEEPADSVPALLELRRALTALLARPGPMPGASEVREKAALLDRILALCLGLEIETVGERPDVVPGEALGFTARASVAADAGVTWSAIEVAGERHAVDAVLTPAQPHLRSFTLEVPAGQPVTQPYWLREPAADGTYRVADPGMIGQPENEPDLAVRYRFSVGGHELVLNDAVIQPRQSPEGEALAKDRVVVIPPVSLSFGSAATLFRPGEKRQVQVEATAARPNVKGEVQLKLPEGWQGSGPQPLALAGPGSRATLVFEVTAPRQRVSAVIGASARVDDRIWTTTTVEVAYPHIPVQRLQPPARLKAAAVEVATSVRKIAYIPGAGDEVATALRELGLEVVLLSPDQLTAEALKPFGAVVIGVRAFNTRPELGNSLMPVLADYVAKGGTVVGQYNWVRNLKTETLAPYRLKLSDRRVTNEQAPVTLLLPEHPALTRPNAITAADFEGWVQERGVYFPTEWDPAFTPLLSMSDPKEYPLEGALLVAAHGKGYYVYTSLAFFRQLPAGVPGAYRLFANLISLGK